MIKNIVILGHILYGIEVPYEVRIVDHGPLLFLDLAIFLTAFDPVRFMQFWVFTFVLVENEIIFVREVQIFDAVQFRIIFPYKFFELIILRILP